MIFINMAELMKSHFLGDSEREQPNADMKSISFFLLTVHYKCRVSNDPDLLNKKIEILLHCEWHKALEYVLVNQLS